MVGGGGWDSTGTGHSIARSSIRTLFLELVCRCGRMPAGEYDAQREWSAFYWRSLGGEKFGELLVESGLYLRAV